MSPVVYLHLGTPKTGTTSLQLFLHNNRQLISNQNFFYPNLYPFMGYTRLHHCGLATVIAAGQGTDDSRIQVFQRMLRQQLKAGRNVIVSAEALYNRISGRVYVDGRPMGSDYWRLREIYVRELARTFSGFDVLPMLTLRRQDAYAVSSFKEQVKTFRPQERGELRFRPWTFQGYLEDHAPLWDYDRQVDMLDSLLGKTRVLRYEDGEINVRILEEMGLSVTAEQIPVTANTGMDPRVALWLSQWGFGSRDEREAFASSDHAASVFHGRESATLWRSASERDFFLETFSAARFGGDYFPQPPTSLPPQARLLAGDAEALAQAYSRWKRDRLTGASFAGLVP